MSRRRWIVAAVVLAASVGGWWLASGARGPEDAGWAAVERGDLVLGVEVSGELQSEASSSLGPPAVQDVWDYKIAFLAPEGASVRNGQKVLGFDTSDLERKLQEKQAEADTARSKIERKRADVELARRNDELRLAEAEARLRKARLKVEVPEDLVQSRDLTKSRIEMEEAEREAGYVRERIAAARRAEAIALGALEKQRDGAERRVREIREAIEAMSVGAPRDGTVIYVTNWRDEKKKVGDTASRHEKIIQIPDLTRMKARGEVDEADAGRIAAGQPLTFRLDAHPDLEYTGRVQSIWGTVQRRSWRDPVKVVRLDIALDATDQKRMRPGMRFRGKIETGRVAGALLVPADAVFSRPLGPVAFRKTLGGFEPVALTLGRRNAEFVEVLAGLDPGDRVARRDLEPAPERPEA